MARGRLVGALAPPLADGRGAARSVPTGALCTTPTALVPRTRPPSGTTIVTMRHSHTVEKRASSTATRSAGPAMNQPRRQRDPACEPPAHARLAPAGRAGWTDGAAA